MEDRMENEIIESAIEQLIRNRRRRKVSSRDMILLFPALSLSSRCPNPVRPSGQREK